MKLQILDGGLDSNREGEKSISFFNELNIGIGTMLKMGCLFFNGLDTGEELCM
jgi:hypothetical protein